MSSAIAHSNLFVDSWKKLGIAQLNSAYDAGNYYNTACSYDASVVLEHNKLRVAAARNRLDAAYRSLAVGIPPRRSPVDPLELYPRLRSASSCRLHNLNHGLANHV